MSGSQESPFDRDRGIQDVLHSSRASRTISTAHSTTPCSSRICCRTFSARAWIRRRSSGSVTFLPPAISRATSCESACSCVAAVFTSVARAVSSRTDSSAAVRGATGDHQAVTVVRSTGTAFSKDSSFNGSIFGTRRMDIANLRAEPVARAAQVTGCRWSLGGRLSLNPTFALRLPGQFKMYTLVTSSSSSRQSPQASQSPSSEFFRVSLHGRGDGGLHSDR